jgi:hypothetical protein
LRLIALDGLGWPLIGSPIAPLIRFADDESMVVAQIDAVANDVPGLEPEGYPTIVLYSKANKEVRAPLRPLPSPYCV